VDRAFIKNILLDYNGAIQDYNTAINNFKVILENSLNDDRIIEEYELAFLYINRASLQIMIREFQCALIDCDISIKIEPEYGKAYLLRGIAKINLGNTEGARSDWLISGELGCFEAYDMIHKYFD
jgi:tetratricopeptide (TPR) repeat protein